MRISIAKKILDNYEKSYRKKEKTMSKAKIHAFTPLTKSYAKVHLTASDVLTEQEIDTSIKKQTKNIFKVVKGSSSFSKKNGVFVYSCIVEHIKNEIKSGFDLETKKLIPIGASTYLDEELNVIWTKKVKDGKPIFIRKINEDINEVLTKAIYANTSSMVRNYYNNVNKDNLNERSLVKAFVIDENGKGKVIEATIYEKKDNYCIVANNGEYYKIPYDSIISKIERIPVDKEREIVAEISEKMNYDRESLEGIMRYLLDVYPEQYKELLNTMLETIREKRDI